jgi:hypothetical protein
MAQGYRGDGKPFLDANGVDQSAARRESEKAPPPKPIEDWKVQVLNALEGGTSRTFYPEANANAATAGRAEVPKPAKESTNPFQAKLDSLENKLYLARGDRKIEGVGNIIAPASETLRLDRVESASGQAPVELPPSAHAQRAAGFMPETDEPKNLVKQTISDHTTLQSNEPKQTETSSWSPLGSELWPAGDTGRGDAGESKAGRLAETLRSATLRPSGDRGSTGGQENDRFTGTRASTPEQWLHGYVNHLAAEAGDGTYKGDQTSLFSHAANSGSFISPKQLRGIAKDEIKGGVEHNVYLPKDQAEDEEKQIYKVTKPDGYGYSGGDEVAYIKYLQDLDALTGGKLNIKILGVTPTDETWPSIVTKMNYVEGGKPGDRLFPDRPNYKPNPSEREYYLRGRLINDYGFKSTGFNEYTHPDTGLKIMDAHAGNFIERPNGDLVPIDVHVEGDVSKPMFMPEQDEEESTVIHHSFPFTTDQKGHPLFPALDFKDSEGDSNNVDSPRPLQDKFQQAEENRGMQYGLFMPEAPDPESPEGKFRQRVINTFKDHSPVVADIFDGALKAINSVGSPQIYEAALNAMRDPIPPVRGKEAANLARLPGGAVYSGMNEAAMEEVEGEKRLYEALLKMHFLTDEDVDSDKPLGHVIDLTGDFHNEFDLSDAEKKLAVSPAVGLLTKLDEARATPWIEETKPLSELGVHRIDESAVAAFDAYFGHDNWLLKDNQGHAGRNVFFPQPLKEILSGRKVNPYWEGDKHLLQNAEQIKNLNPAHFIVQRQFDTGITPGQRLIGVTVASNEKRVHIQTDPDTGVHVIRYATWDRGNDKTPNFIEDYETQMAQLAALKAVEAMKPEHKSGQFYGVDVVPSQGKKYKYGIAELNPAMTANEDPEGQGGLSGFMADHPMSIDAYVNALRGELPFHARIARVLLAMKVKEQQRANAHEWPVAEEGSHVLAGAQY